MKLSSSVYFFFFFNDTATTEIYTLSLHDALPICSARCSSLPTVEGNLLAAHQEIQKLALLHPEGELSQADRKSTRLNSSHLVISYAVFCLKKKREKCRIIQAVSSVAYYRRQSPLA